MGAEVEVKFVGTELVRQELKRSGYYPDFPRDKSFHIMNGSRDGWPNIDLKVNCSFISHHPKITISPSKEGWSIDNKGKNALLVEHSDGTTEKFGGKNAVLNITLLTDGDKVYIPNHEDEFHMIVRIVDGSIILGVKEQN